MLNSFSCFPEAVVKGGFDSRLGSEVREKVLCFRWINIHGGASVCQPEATVLGLDPRLLSVLLELPHHIVLRAIPTAIEWRTGCRAFG